MKKVFTTDVNKIEWKDTTSEAWVVPAGISSFTVSIDAEDEGIKVLGSKVTQHIIVGHDYSVSVEGIRVNGDPGQELVVSKMFSNGADAEVNVRVTIGKTLQITSVGAVKVTDLGTGETGKVGRFGCEFLNADDTEPQTSTVLE